MSGWSRFCGRNLLEQAFVRGTALVYLAALLSLHLQFEGLFGPDGISPLDASLVRARLTGESFFSLPTAFWLSSAPGFGNAIFGLGYAAACAALVGVLPGPAYLIMWFVYLSFLNGCERFLDYQWDNLLCETCFWMGVLLPWRLRLDAASPILSSRWRVWTMQVLVIRLMFESGIVKLLSGDPTWRNLTAMVYHYMTQPLPNPVSWYVYWLPEWWHRIETALALVIETAVPFLAFAGPRGRWVAASAFVLLQVCILLTGNYGFFNVLTILLCTPLLFRVPVPDELRAGRDAVGTLSLGIVVCAFALHLQAMTTRTLLPVQRPLWHVLTTYRLSCPYGLFAVMTTRRPELVLEVSADGENWREVDFRYKPGLPTRRPPIVILHMPRLDWQMWFAALSPGPSPWLYRLLDLLTSTKPEGLLTLFPPESRETLRKARHARLVLYEYHFSTPDERASSGAWWTRDRLGVVLTVGPGYEGELAARPAMRR